MNFFEKVIITFSGGKDSSTTLQLYLNYKIKNPNCKARLTVISADTRIENPLLIEHIYRIKERIASLDIEINFHIVMPELKETFFVRVFGSGYNLPSTMQRWCVNRLKKDPADRMLEEISKKNVNTLLVLGTRSAESANRSKSVEKHFGDGFFSDHPLPNITTCSPIKK